MKIPVTKKLIAIGLLALVGCSGDSTDSIQDTGSITVEFILASLPATITYNKPTTPDGYVEYKWSVTFDVNNDGVVNAGDIVLQILHFKMPGTAETTGTIEDLNASVWLYTTDTQTTRQVDAESSVAGNTITISINRNRYPLLDLVKENTLVNFTCSTYDEIAGFSKYDYYPGFSTVTSIPLDGQFSDSQGDADFAYIDMEAMHITL